MDFVRVPWSSSPSPVEEQYRDAGLQRTTGTQFLMPPCDSDLIDAFSRKHKGTQMTVGSRALCKHHVRLKDHPFWTTPSGSPSAKNEAAYSCLLKIMMDAVWKNVHMLTRTDLVYEIRNSQGYGVRWTLRPRLAFRGFLER